MENINVLINKARVEKRIEELANQIQKDYEGKDIIFIGILKGSVNAVNLTIEKNKYN